MSIHSETSYGLTDLLDNGVITCGSVVFDTVYYLQGLFILGIDAIVCLVIRIDLAV